MSERREQREVIYESFWANKWLIDGCKTLLEMAVGLEAAAKELREYHEAGVYLEGEVDNGMVDLYVKDKAVADKYGFHVPEYEDEDEDDYEDEDDHGDYENDDETTEVEDEKGGEG